MSETIRPLAYSFRSASRVTDLPRTTLYDLIGRNEIAAFKVGRRTMIRADSLHAYLDSLPPARIGAGRRTPRAA